MNKIVTLKANLASALNRQRLAEERQLTLNWFERMLDHSLAHADTRVDAARKALSEATHQTKQCRSGLYDTLCSGDYENTNIVNATAAVIIRAIVR